MAKIAFFLFLDEVDCEAVCCVTLDTHDYLTGDSYCNMCDAYWNEETLQYDLGCPNPNNGNTSIC